MMTECKRYLTLTDIQTELQCNIRFVSPYAEAGKITIQAGEILLLDEIDNQGGVATCIPMRYRTLHSSLVPEEILSDCDYTGQYYLVIQLEELKNSCKAQIDISKTFVGSSSLDCETINSMIGNTIDTMGCESEEYECDLIRCPSCNHIFLLFKSDNLDWDLIVPDPNDLFEWKPVYSDRLFECLNCGKPFIEEENWEGKTYPYERTSVYEARICAANQLWLDSYRLDEFRVPWELLKGSDWAKWIVEPGAALAGDSAALHPRQ